MSPHRWQLEARKPDADGDGQPHEHDTEPGADEPEKDGAEDTEGQGFRFPNAEPAHADRSRDTEGHTSKWGLADRGPGGSRPA